MHKLAVVEGRHDAPNRDFVSHINFTETDFGNSLRLQLRADDPQPTPPTPGTSLQNHDTDQIESSRNSSVIDDPKDSENSIDDENYGPAGEESDSNSDSSIEFSNNSVSRKVITVTTAGY
ncbi:hypothetical protein HHI36_016460 [Cryptolaemus montrouzieri]|uniref:Uncharacterized protein n=1 Tax=Cryptolaemus montrouzieri TaxID=559131 RepID=A0ABD2NKL0_9CUCU